jgi:hypothetical protein
VLVVVPARHHGEPWTAVIPRKAFGVAADVTMSRLEDVDAGTCFDHIVVPFEASRETPADALLSALRPVLRRGGSLAALMPGPAYQPPPGRDTMPSGAGARPTDVLALGRRLFPDARVSVESFGNARTAQAVAAGSPARDVVGAEIDRHDQRTQVLVTLAVSGGPAPTRKEMGP